LQRKTDQDAYSNFSNPHVSLIARPIAFTINHKKRRQQVIQALYFPFSYQAVVTTFLTSYMIYIPHFKAILS